MNEELQKRLLEHNEFAKNKHPGLVGVVITSLQPSEVKGEFAVTESVIAGTGYLWAPVIITLADWLASVGTANNIPDTHSFTTIELKTNFLGSAKEGQVVSGVATASHIGKSTQVWDVDIFNNESGKKIALFRCTQMVLSPPR